MRDDNCIFCKILNGEIPSIKLYEDGKTFAFMDINPANPGHALVIPKYHAANLLDIPADSPRAFAQQFGRFAYSYPFVHHRKNW